MHTKYGSIADGEDVPDSIKTDSKYNTRYRCNLIARTVGVLTMLLIFLFFSWKLATWSNSSLLLRLSSSSPSRSGGVSVVQTCMTNGDRLSALDVTAFNSRGFPLDSVSFGNSYGSALSTLTSTSAVGKISVDSTKSDQVF